MKTRAKYALLAALLAAVSLSACDNASQAGSSPAQYAAPNTAQEAYALAAKGHGVEAGILAAANVVYVYFDPQCPHCATLWANSQPLLGKVRMRWIPVGMLGARSVRQGAALLGAADRLAAMQAHEASMSKGQGGVTPKEPTAEESRLMDENTAIFRALGGSSVPYLVFKNAKTGQYASFAGSMTTQELRTALGL